MELGQLVRIVFTDLVNGIVIFFTDFKVGSLYIVHYLGGILRADDRSGDSRGLHDETDGKLGKCYSVFLCKRTKLFDHSKGIFKIRMLEDCSMASAVIIRESGVGSKFTGQQPLRKGGVVDDADVIFLAIIQAVKVQISP